MFLNNRFTARLFSIIQQLEFDVNNSLYFVLVQSTIYPLAISDVEVGSFYVTVKEFVLTVLSL